MAYHNRVEEFSFSDISLIAGDSNVHRLKKVLMDENNGLIECLPISGARYSKDRKNFRGRLKCCLTGTFFQHVYLFLGSNDVLSSEELFYRNVTEVCDLIHATSPQTEIILCEVLPRGPNRTRRPGQRLSALQRWIMSANNMLSDICTHMPYVRFLSCGSFLLTRHLSPDGLHLNSAGAKHCCSLIALDNVKHLSMECKVARQEVECDDDWPAIGEVAPTTSQDSSPLYANIVKTQVYQGKSRPAERVNQNKNIVKPLKKKIVCIPHRHQRRHRAYRQGRKRWFKKKFTRKVNIRCYTKPKESVLVNLDHDIAVQLPAHRISGGYRKPRNVQQPKTSTHDETFDHPLKQQPRPMYWLPCPECEVKCSREDFLLDHVIRRHASTRTNTSDMKLSVTLTSNSRALSDLKPRNVQQPKTSTHDETFDHPLKQQPRPVVDSKVNGYVHDKMSVFNQTYIKRPYSSCEGVYHVFPRTMWQSVFQLMTLGLLYGRDGMHHIVLSLLLIQKDVDTTKLRLLMANDVEQNPGPVYKCGWENCTQMLDTPSSLKMHAVEHGHKEKKCSWNGCPGYNTTNFEDLWPHIIDHVIKTEDYFTSIDEWYKFLPGGVFKERTNLSLCPVNLRSKLQLMLFDEDFTIKKSPYTTVDHRNYLNRLSIENHSHFLSLKSEFVEKRKRLGEDWSNFKQKKTESTCTESCYINPNVNQPEQPVNLACSGTLSIPRNRKRKHCEEEASMKYFNKDSPWFKCLIGNLESCDYAIKLQQRILNTIEEKDLLTSSKQGFFKIEKEAARLASFNNCTNGTFVCTVIKCTFELSEFVYVRYVESGVYSGFMSQKFVPLLKEKYNLSDENLFLHNVITHEDISEMNYQNNISKVKRVRPDKILNHSLQKNIPVEVCNLNNFGDCDELKLDSYIVHILPFKSKINVDTPEKMYLEMKEPPLSSLQNLFLDFRLNKLKARNLSSKDILNEPTFSPKSLMEQSVLLNCMSGDVKRKPHLFKREPRFESNFLSIDYIATCLRNRTLQFYLHNRLNELYNFFIAYFEELDDSPKQTSAEHVPIVNPKRRKRSTCKSVRKLKVTRTDLEKQIPASAADKQVNNVDLYQNYCLSLIEHGKFSIQYYDPSLLICCMNDYSETDGSFRCNDFIYTVKQKQETGDYFFCSCSIYRTLINIQQCKNIDEDLVLDSAGENCVTCMHCKFLKEKVVAGLETSINGTGSRLQDFLQNALSDKGKDIVELSNHQDTRKFSVLTEDEDRPSFVHVTFNKRQEKYIVSCLNGKCLSLRGHKKIVSALSSSTVCKHLSVFRNHSEFWQELLDCDNDNTETDRRNETKTEINSNAVNTETVNFDESSGLWNFNCRSLHSPSEKNSQSLRCNLIKRDGWNDMHFERRYDGCLNGPVLVSDIPENTCDCGSGWLKRNEETDYSENGLTLHDRGRMLTIYTANAPVKCEVHVRLCYNSVNPCKIIWDEGEKDCLHVLSRDTAAGDEIGWEFVTMVMNSGCTFSSYCQYKSDSYKLRNDKAKFMDSTVFVNWWFSWAANMKIDFRRPCDVCGFKPKRLCCDGTKVGVGFRHASFEEVNRTDPNQEIESTLHRRMDRCFLKNMNGIDKKHMILNRETLDYLGKLEIGELDEKEIICQEELTARINSVKEVLPDEVLPSFERYFVMESNEKLAYAYVLKMLSTTASVTSLLPPSYCSRIQQLVNDPNTEGQLFNSIVNEMRSYAPELRDLICESMLCNDIMPQDIRLLIQYLINESLDMQVNIPETALAQPGTYNPGKFGRAYYFSESGLKLRNVRKFTIDNDKNVKRNVDHDDSALEFERCQKLYSKVQTSAPGTSNLFLWFCADHGHCYGFHMTGAEGRKDPFASLYSHLEQPPSDIFYDFACNLQEYCLNRESGYYKDVRFFHDIFHSYAHKCSCAFKSSRLQGFESVNSEICEQFNSFIQCIKRSARQMSQTHFCFYLQFFLHQWNERKRNLCEKKLRIALAGIN